MVARGQLGEMPRVHVETARLQLGGCLALLDDDVEELLRRAPTERDLIAEPRELARAALVEHDAWLHDRMETSQRDPRLGDRAYAAQLWYALDTEIDPDALLTRAESDLMATEEEIASVAARIGPGLGVPQEQAALGHGARRPRRTRRLRSGHQRHRPAAVPALAEGHHRRCPQP